MNQAGSDLHPPLERIARSERFSQMQTFGMKHGQAGQHLGIDTVGLGVLGEIVPKVRGLLCRHQHNNRPAPAEPRRQRNPSVAGRFHDHHDLARLGG
jgi:hypothetical protein